MYSSQANIVQSLAGLADVEIAMRRVPKKKGGGKLPQGAYCLFSYLAHCFASRSYQS
jgi:hypothetical protein